MCEILLIFKMFLVEGLHHNLISVCQLCDDGYNVLFASTESLLLDHETQNIIYRGQRKGNIYLIILNNQTPMEDICFIVER